MDLLLDCLLLLFGVLFLLPCCSLVFLPLGSPLGQRVQKVISITTLCSCDHHCMYVLLADLNGEGRRTNDTRYEWVMTRNGVQASWSLFSVSLQSNYLIQHEYTGKTVTCNNVCTVPYIHYVITANARYIFNRVHVVCTQWLDQNINSLAYWVLW